MEQTGASVCRPVITSAKESFIRIKAGKHPALLKYRPNLIANDLNLCKELMLFTGPNMGGKSTLMRQTGLIIIMAQMGCYVPSSECIRTPVDRIFTRLGASDRIIEGESTFYVELSETLIQLNHCLCNCFVLLDELGRGTSTYDGTAIASSVVNQLIS